MSQPTVLPSVSSDVHHVGHNYTSRRSSAQPDQRATTAALEKHMLSSIMVVSSTDEDEDESAFLAKRNSSVRIEAATPSQPSKQPQQNPQRPIAPGAPHVGGVLNSTTKTSNATALLNSNSISNSDSIMRMRGRKPSFLEADGTVVPIRPRSPGGDGALAHPPLPLRPLNPNMSTPAEKNDKKKKRQSEKLQKLQERANSPSIETMKKKDIEKGEEKGKGSASRGRDQSSKKDAKPSDGGTATALMGDGAVSYRPPLSPGDSEIHYNTSDHPDMSNGEKVLPNTVRSPSMAMDLVALPPDVVSGTPDMKDTAPSAMPKEANTPFRALHIAPLARLEDELEAQMQHAAEGRRHQHGAASPFATCDTAEDDDEDDLEEFIVCPFSVLSCCAEGRHARRDLTHPRLVHQHALAVARTTQELRADHAVLQQQYSNMQKRLRNQKTAMAHMQNEIEQLRQYILSSHGEGERGASSNSGNSGKGGGRSASTEKALPRDVSHVLEDDLEDKDTHSEGAYARRLRIRTSSAACLYDQAPQQPPPQQTSREASDRRATAPLPSKVLSEEVHTPKYGPRACSHRYPSSEAATADGSEAAFSSYRDESAISPISSASFDVADLDREGDGELAAMHALIRSPSASPQLAGAAPPPPPPPGPVSKKQHDVERQRQRSPLSAPSLVSMTQVPAQLAAAAAPAPAPRPSGEMEVVADADAAVRQKESEFHLTPPSPRSSRSHSKGGGGGNMAVTLKRKTTVSKSGVENRKEEVVEATEAVDDGATRKPSRSKKRGSSPSLQGPDKKSVPLETPDPPMHLLDHHSQSVMQPSRPASDFSRETLSQQRPLLRNAASHAHLKKKTEH